MARSPRPPWSDGLPPELLGVIFEQLSCLADRACFAAVCRPWRTAAAFVDAPQRGLPWLLLPSRDAPSFFSLHSGATRHLTLPEGVRGARLCGAHDGGWVAVAVDPWRGFAAVNLFTGVRVTLPEKLRLEVPYAHGYGPVTVTSHHPMLVRTIVFSAPPASPDCIAAAHVSSASNIAFWQPGMSRHWIASRPEPDVIQDIIYYSGEEKQGFHVLTNREEVLVFAPRAGRDPNALLEMTCASYQMRRRANHLPASFIATRYLVESRGKLLMVVRHCTGNPRVRRRTRMFRVFEMSLLPTGAYWLEIHELSGRALFLRRGCSRAVEVSQFKMLKEDTIYFRDDTTVALCDSLVMNDGSRYNMGIYRDGKKIRAGSRQFPRVFTADCSPPIWLVP